MNTREPIYVYECGSAGLYRCFAICSGVTQEPIQGFEELVMNHESAVEFALRLSTAETEEEIESIRREAERKSDQVQFDLYHL